MKEIESIASALFDKIRSRFPNITLGDESAKAETDPEKARFFNFTYASEDGAEFGKVTISLIDETSLKVYYGQNISGEMDTEQRQEWYKLLRNLRQFAKRNLLTFDTRDINKSNLKLQDLKQQAKTDDTFTTQDVTVTESKLYGTPGRPYNSFADEGATKILIRHKDKVDDSVRGSRARKIQEIFLETDRGERFLLGHTNLHGARALAQHLNQGGTLHDSIADHINNMVAEMAAMSHFVRSTKHRQFEDQETADMTASAINHFEKVKHNLRIMRGARGFKNYFGNYTEEEALDDDVDVDALRERFVKKVYDDRFTDALPIVYKAYKKYKAEAAVQLGSELDEWATEVSEGTWAKPDSQDKVQALKELLKTPLTVGIDGIDAQTKIEPLIGDDDLYDDIFELSQQQGSDADATGLVKAWLQSNMPSVYSNIQSELQQLGRDEQTNWQAPTSPEEPNDTYGSQPSHPNVSNMAYENADPLEFIRSLAGIRK
jgi:hypothetical protein